MGRAFPVTWEVLAEVGAKRRAEVGWQRRDGPGTMEVAVGPGAAAGPGGATRGGRGREG